MSSVFIISISMVLSVVTALKFKEKKVMILMSLEMMMFLIMLILFVEMKFFELSSMNSFMSLVLLMVTESILGLSIMTASSRNSSFKSSMYSKWF